MDMKHKIIAILTIVFILIISSILVLKNKDLIKVTLSCKDKETGCTYIKQTKTPVELNFKYEEISQCSVESIYKKVENDEDDELVVETYELVLFISSKGDLLKIKHHNAKELAMICAKIFDKHPFELKTKIRNEDK